ncbi:hypothetical protein [Ureibacillus manganicus]|uniref:hypothetical protein n=1 Tax=Ureibacillus manganicus TaxID=1266064 RepID=UPI00068FA472|nr:hypothetical protein [Ureibacillus manganicus]
MSEMFEKNYPELQKDGRFTSPPSGLPMYELKMLQEYIHSANLQNLGTVLPNSKQQMVLLKFFKSKKNQLVEIHSSIGDDIIHTIGKVAAIGRNFVMLKTLFVRYWIPYPTIKSAKSPFGIPDVSGTHQHVAYDQELRNKLLTNFGSIVAEKEVLRQQFYEELFETNLKTWKGTKVTIYTKKNTIGKIIDVRNGKVLLNNGNEISISKINYIKQSRINSFWQRLFSKWFTKKSNKRTAK